MSLLLIVLLGILQGITEFVPVSSSGHLILGQHFFDMTELGLEFDVALHLGTLLALLIYFRRDLIGLLQSVIHRTDDARLAWLLAFATLPAVVFGLLLEDVASNAFRAPWLVAMNLSVVGLAMLLAERHYQTKVDEPTALTGTSRTQALAMGFAQAVALVPGVSRSGITILSGLYVGMDRVAATRFSFLLGIPIMSGAVVRVFSRSETIEQISEQQTAFAVGALAAFLSGLVAIRFLLRFLSRHSLAAFAYYRFGLSVLVVVALLVSA